MNSTCPSMISVLGAFRGAGYDVLIHVPNPEASRLRAVADAYEPIAGHRITTPKIEDAERGVVRFLEFGDEFKRQNLESWLASEHGWTPLPRPLRANVAFQNQSDSDFVEDTAKVFSALQTAGWEYRRWDVRIGGCAIIGKFGTPATNFFAGRQVQRARISLQWQTFWNTLEPPVPIPNWVSDGGTPGNPRSRKSRFSSLELVAELLNLSDRFSLEGDHVLRQGITTFLWPMVEAGDPIALEVPGESSSESDWPSFCSLRFKFRS